MRVAIIGAGPTGLISLKYGIDEGHECDAYEQTGDIGGLWVYRDEVADENDSPVSPMYKDLRTNLPKENMTVLDFPYPQMAKSYIARPHVLDYFHRFASCFRLERRIKFHRRVTQVSPIPNERWKLTIQNVKTKEEISEEYDAVFVCNGHFHIAKMPEIPGESLFKGSLVHSLYFRTADQYRDKRVLIIGGGPSGVDISRIVSEVSEYVFISHRSPMYFSTPPPNVTKKPAVSCFVENEVIFKDGSKEYIDVVIYCTGYKYDFPFLTESCGIQVIDNCVMPLHKQIINIEHPTMYFIGLISRVCVIPTFDIQVRFALASLNRHFPLPTKEAMLKELEVYVDELERNGVPRSNLHQLPKSADFQQQYYQDLATTAGIRPMPPVITSIFRSIKNNRDPSTCFTIIDDENFIVTPC